VLTIYKYRVGRLFPAEGKNNLNKVQAREFFLRTVMVEFILSLAASKGDRL
jgi:hypothetical protein